MLAAGGCTRLPYVDSEIRMSHPLTSSGSRKSGSSPPEVTREDQPPRFALLLKFDLRNRRADDVAGIAKPHADFRKELMPLAVRQRLELADDSPRLLFAIQRLDPGGAAGKMPVQV